MTEVKKLNVGGHEVEAVRMVAPGGEGHANMIVLICEKGFIMCGYLNMDTANAVKDAAAVIGGATFDDLLANPVKAVSEEGKALGIKVGMTGEEVVAILS